MGKRSKKATIGTKSESKIIRQTRKRARKSKKFIIFLVKIVIIKILVLRRSL